MRIVLALLALVAARCPGQANATSDNKRQTALALEQQGNNTEAETTWRAILKLHPSDAEAYAHLGLLEALQQRYTEAVPLYRKALTLNPSMPGLRLNLGLALFQSGDLKAAIVDFTALLKSEPASSPESLRLTTLIGLAHYGLGEYSAAIPYLKRVTADNPQNLPIRLALAQSCLWSKQYQCVLDVYHQILDLNAESAEADMLAGEALDEMKNVEGALQQFRAAAKADPTMPNVHFGVGYLLWRLKQYDEAAQEFNSELANNPGQTRATVYLADTDMHQGHPAAATALLEKVIRVDPKIELAHLDLGILYGDTGREEDALRELQTAEKLDPKDVHVHWRLARLYQTTGRKDEAKAEFDKTRNIDQAADGTILNQLHKPPVKDVPTKQIPDAPTAH